jgi:uncharacterized protein involved in exopolysaccharide biosynthesis
MFRQGEYELRDAFWALARRRVVVLSSTVAFLGLAAVLNVVTRPVYVSTARLAIHTSPSRSALTGALIESPTSNSENIALLTTAERILSRDVLERVAQELRASKHALHAPALHSIGDWLAAPTQAADADQSPSLNEDVEQLVRTVNVRPIRDTRLVDVQAEHFEPRTAALIANLVSTQFLDHEAEQRQEANHKRIIALEHPIRLSWR